MLFNVLLTISLITSTTAGQTLTEILRSHNNLSQWYRLIKPFWAELDALTNVTVFVPNNDAIVAYFNTPHPDGCISTDLDMLRASMYYHMSSVSFDMNSSDFNWGLTRLYDGAYSPDNDNETIVIVRSPHIYASSGQVSQYTGESWTFEGGIIHVVDRVLQLPLPTDLLLNAHGLNQALALMVQTNMNGLLDYRGLGVFAPTDQAFNAIGSELSSDNNTVYNSRRFTDLAKYHLFNGSAFTAGSDPDYHLLTLLGENVTFLHSSRYATTYVNNAFCDAWLGVLRGRTAHVFIIDQVLNPQNTTAPLNVSAWPGATPGLTILFTPQNTTQIPLCMNPFVSHKANTAAIVGGTIGGIVVLLALSGSVWFSVRRRKLKLSDLDLKSELPGDKPRTELGPVGGILRVELPVSEKGELSTESQKHELRAVDLKEMLVEPTTSITSELPAYKSVAEYLPELDAKSCKSGNEGRKLGTKSSSETSDVDSKNDSGTPITMSADT